MNPIEEEDPGVCLLIVLRGLAGMWVSSGGGMSATKEWMLELCCQFLSKGQWTYGPTLCLSIDTHIRSNFIESSTFE